MHIYTLYITDEYDKFKIGLDNVTEQIDINISHYNTEIYVSLFFDSDCHNHIKDGKQNSIVNQLDKTPNSFKIKLKTLMYIISHLNKFDFNVSNKHDVNMMIKKINLNYENIIGKITYCDFIHINQQIQNQYIKIVLHHIYKVSYSYFNETLLFKHIFYSDYVLLNEIIKPLNKHKIILSTNRIFDLVMTYDTLYKVIYKNITKNSLMKIYDIINDDIYLFKIYSNFNNDQKRILMEDLENIEFEKNEIKYFFIHFY